MQVQLSPADRAQATAKRKVVYLELHSDTRSVTERGGSGMRAAAGEAVSRAGLLAKPKQGGLTQGARFTRQEVTLANAARSSCAGPQGAHILERCSASIRYQASVCRPFGSSAPVALHYRSQAVTGELISLLHGHPIGQSSAT